MTEEERILRLENSFVTLVELLENHEARFDSLTEAQANSEAKIAALADAQIRTEATMETLAATMSTLAAAQVHTDQRLDALIDIVRRRFERDAQG
jgi:hypothetical protein